MGKRDFTGLRLDAAADKRGHRGGMVRRAEWAGARKLTALKQAGDRLYLRGFKQFARRQRRQQARQPLGEHRLSRARRAAIEGVMPAAAAISRARLAPS